MDNLNLLQNYNLIVSGHRFHDALSKVGNKICENSRNTLEQDLELIRTDPELVSWLNFCGDTILNFSSF